TGLAAWVIYPFAILVLVLTIIGIPIAILLAMLIPVIYLIGLITTAIALGNGRIREMLGNSFTWAKEPNILIGAIIGVLVLWLVGKAPIVGALVIPIVAVLGMGVALTTKFGTNKPWFKGSQKKKTDMDNVAPEDKIELQKVEHVDENEQNDYTEREDVTNEKKDY
ncbi:MAG: hypothetical protein SCK28_15240, partial [Bacillota bacterium]|nr:hypothetical protein [Bacillota bacterium]